MKTIKGNLLDMFDAGDFDIIVHGCNCHNNMGGGIAAQIAKRYPAVEAADNATIEGNINKLGYVRAVWLSNRFLRWVKKPRIVVNAYTQYHPGADANLQAIVGAFHQLSMAIHNNGWHELKIGIPAIGCGIGGLVWEDVEAAIAPICRELDITLVVFE